MRLVAHPKAHESFEMIWWEPLTNAGSAARTYADQSILCQSLSAYVGVRQHSISKTGKIAPEPNSCLHIENHGISQRSLDL
jgi:hypothetical protein